MNSLTVLLEPVIDYSQIVNENCGLIQTAPVETTDLIIQNDPFSVSWFL